MLILIRLSKEIYLGSDTSWCSMGNIAKYNGRKFLSGDISRRDGKDNWVMDYILGII